MHSVCLGGAAAHAMVSPMATSKYDEFEKYGLQALEVMKGDTAHLQIQSLRV